MTKTERQRIKRQQKRQQNNNGKKIHANSSSSRGGRNSSLFGYHLTGGYHNSNTNLDYWDSAGYPKKLEFGDLWNMQARFGIAKAGIHKIVDKCWQSPPRITDGEFDGKRQLTSFEADLKVLVDKHHLYSRLKGGDWRGRVGRYSAILPIIKETNPGSPSDPITNVNGVEAIVKFVPKFESEVSVDSVGTNGDITSEHYGMPEHYDLREDVNGDRNPITNTQIQLHPSRVFIMAEGADDGSIFGIPANEAGFNALMDLEIICASGQTGLRKNAKQRFVSNINDNQVATALKDANLKAQYDSNVDDFNRGDSPNLTVYGMDISTLQSTLADPTQPFTNSLNVYAASINTPASEIIGVQMNKQASEGNQTEFNDSAKSRRENFLNPTIKGFLEYLINIGAMSKPTNEILIEWDDLNEDTPGEKLDLSKKMVEINKVDRDSGGTGQVYTTEEIRLTSGNESEPEGEFEEFTEDDEDPNKDSINES